MSGINPVSGVGPVHWPKAAGGVTGGTETSGKVDFGKMLSRYIDNVDHDQQASASAVRDLLAGKTQDPLGVITAAAKADLSFKLLIGVRNKVIDAYKQTMNMQI